MKKYIITLIVCLLATLAAQAQNSIDNLVERYSSMGGSSFTTAVKRNPQTQKVVKVVKTLEMDSSEGGTFYRVFKRESHTGSWTEKVANNEHTTLLVVEKPQQARIYMLKRNSNSYGKVKVTIIIQPK
ncbi:DUF5024 domain-containing protein [Prevotella falsenii]|uniref:DUF5024 domain-containing protein n=1 Tax=Prevotella falsenii TaxID=515414 RepID=UPI00046AFB1D|nr:DUF5024 domain-containing protein [Prevotella falsenii]